jgi:two-component system CheB/CheR fusion protein
MDNSEASDPVMSPNSSPTELVPVVGLGASAGGLAALERFFANVPADAPVAFVVVTHQHPDHPSMLHELIGRKTTLPVHMLGDAVCTIQAGHVYVAPPGRVLAILGNRVHTTERDPKTSLFLPIDIFFRSLAEDRRDRAVGIILSGTGADGTLGIKEIKAALGMVMVQEESSATYAGMPRSAIQTGVVDYVLPVEEMPAQLLGYLRNAGHLSNISAEVHATLAFDGIFLLLRRHTGNDFSHYKLSTIERRIERRMNVRRVASIPAYLEVLHEFPEELDLLFHDLLIGVTSFFRDPEAFDVLAARLPDMVAAKGEGMLRVWVSGCSTGEEAYSIAMLLCEYMDETGQSVPAQIFATDIDPNAIENARKGCYPVGIAHHVSPERLTRFFTIAEDMFRIKKEVRELVVFSTQNLISDPPFIKLDLLSCRNLLIYFSAAVQQRLIPMFHYALRPGGLLLLGSSESVGNYASSFETLDKKWKLYRRTDSMDGQYVSTLSIQGMHGPTVNTISTVPSVRPALSQVHTIERMMLQELVPPTVIVNERGDVVHVHGRTGRFLEPAPGSQHSVSIYDMAREGLRLALSAAIRQASSQSEPEVVRRDVQIGSNGGTLLVDLRIKRVRDTDRVRNLLLITFERVRPWMTTETEPPPAEVGPHLDRMLELERELQYTKESHQGTIEELETSNEELKSTNEELQSTNEELQSANEELETSKEEMQSLNEELQTVNAELQGKIEELSRANDDMKNLLNGTDIATVFLDNKLNIKRYTEQAKHVIRLIHTDVGRPIGDLVSRLRYDRLVEDAQEVLRTLVFKETEVRAEDGSWYLMRILPYRTIDNMIDGLVITFIDITKFKELQDSEARLNNLLRTSPTAILGQNRELRYTWVAGTVLGRNAGVGKSDADLFPASEAERLTALKRAVLDTGKPRREAVTLTVDGVARTYDIYLQPLRDDGEGQTELASIATDVTTRTYEP